MPQRLVKTLLQALPRHSEEGGLWYSVPRLALIDTISKRHTVEPAIVENTVLLCERLLETLSVLDGEHLSRDEWRFVSFPAQLLATSVLTALSDDESRLFAVDFWNTQDTDHSIKNRQLEVLKQIENARNDHHARRQAIPIRYCHVAWSIIKLDGHILFYQREDTHKRHDKSAGDYGLIGGRANQNDVSMRDKTELLRALQSPQSKVVKAALPETLKRELREETGLEFGLHYTFKPWRRLQPYRQTQGAAPNHALTEYYLELYQIELTLEGYLFLRQKTRTDERLVWFSIADTVEGMTSDGKIPYIQALREDFSNDQTALGAALTALPDSFSSHYRVQHQKYGITFPVGSSARILAGVLGKEKALDLRLTAHQRSILLGLAAHLKGFNFNITDAGILLHPYGWIDVAANPLLQSELMALSASLKTENADVVIENNRDFLFRLSIEPGIVFFDESLFSFTVKNADLASCQTKIPVRIHRRAFATALGKVDGKTEEFKLTLKFVDKLRHLQTHTFSTDHPEAEKIEDTYKKGLHCDPNFLVLGLRGLIRREAGIMKFVLPYQIIGETE